MDNNPFLMLTVLLPFIGAFVPLLLGRRNAQVACCTALAAIVPSCLALAAAAYLATPEPGGFFIHATVAGLGLHLRLDGFRLLYASIALLMWLVSTAFSREYFGRDETAGRYQLFSLLTLGATLGVFLSGDLATTFLFFEVMSFTSYVMVVHDRTPEALKAGATYLTVAVFGGLTMLMGLFLLYHTYGTLALTAAYQTPKNPTVLYVAGILLLVGFGAKAGMFPLHIWLPQAHPVAPAPASALLSGIMTKAGVFGVLVLGAGIFLHDSRWGTLLLVPAVITMVLGAVLALFSIDLKRTLACSSVSQIGFILVGASMQGLLGEHNALAVWGTLLHMVNHSLLKLLLFLAAGAVYMNTHKLDLNGIRGFARGKPLFAAVFLSGTLGITGIPFFGGYISKTLLHESVVEGIGLYAGLPLGQLLQVVEILFLFTGGLTVAYMLKLCVALFSPHGDNQSPGRQWLSGSNKALLVLCACFPPLLGVPAIAEAIAGFGQAFMHGHNPGHAVHYFDWTNLKGAAISLTVGLLVYFLVVRLLLMRRSGSGVREYVDSWPGKLDLQRLVYRPLVKAIVFLGVLLGRVMDTLPDALIRLVRERLLRTSSPKPFPGKFLGSFYWLFYPNPEKPKEASALSNGFSYSLLMFGIGLVVMLLYVFVAVFLGG